MSDYYDDSFDSFESGSEHDSGSEGTTSKQLDSRLQVVQDPRMKELMAYSSAGTMGRSNSDHEDYLSPSLSLSSTLKVESSPKPKRKFRVPKPNIGKNIKQKIRSRLKKDVAVFGVPLETAVQRSQLGTDGVELPTVFREFIDFLEEHGLSHEGLYRLAGVKSKIEDLKSRYDKGESVNLEEYTLDPNVVASAMKLYLRELPDSLIPQKLASKFEAAAALPSAEQAPLLLELMEEVPPLNRLMLGWLTVHMTHVAEQSSVNKMSLPNLVIVFSPTLQIPAPILHALYHNSQEIFADIELTKYERPVEKPRKSVNQAYIGTLETEEEITAELERLTHMLEKLHNKMAGKHDEQREDNIWEVQRSITELRRKKKAIQKASQTSLGKADEEFIKTLILMEATLAAENEELAAKKEELQAAIRKEVELIEQFKKELEKYPSHSTVLANNSDEESGDEGELAKKVAALKWHGKELELRNKNLIKSIQEEEEAIMQLRVQLKVLPLKQKLNLEDQA